MVQLASVFFESFRIKQRLADHAKMHPHWWTPNYYKFAGYEEQLPFDAHTAKAVIAPRALLNTHATEITGLIRMEPR